MFILPLLGYIGVLLGFSFLTLSIASGLYYISELVEEHSVVAHKVLRNLIYGVVVAQALLWLIDGFPFTLTALGIASQAVYASNLRHFPIVKLGDPLFLLSCALVIVNHWVWFRHFSEPSAFDTRTRGGISRDKYSSGVTQPSFTEIASYFGLCVWLVPFALFVSLSAGENVLPSMGSEYATGNREGVGTFKKGHKRRNTGMAKAAVNSANRWMGETGAAMGLWQNENIRRFD